MVWTLGEKIGQDNALSDFFFFFHYLQCGECCKVVPFPQISITF